MKYLVTILPSWSAENYKKIVKNGEKTWQKSYVQRRLSVIERKIFGKSIDILLGIVYYAPMLKKDGEWEKCLNIA